MNILLSLNTHYSKYALVMLVSLFENNKDAGIRLYVLYNELSAEAKTQITDLAVQYGNKVVFIYVDTADYKEFPTTDVLTTECYLICLAHLYLPSDMSRILYLDSDMIINGDLSELYHSDFEDKLLIACGQTFEKIKGNYYRIGAQAYRGQKFNSGVLLYNLKKMRIEVTRDSFLEAARDAGYDFSLADQGILNIFYENKAKIISSKEFNFRIGILEDHLVRGCEMPEGEPVIIHFVNRDYYRIGIPAKPWQMTLDDVEKNALRMSGDMRCPYIFKKADAYRDRIFAIWWEYAERIPQGVKIREEMLQQKSALLKNRFPDWNSEAFRKRAEVAQKRKSIMAGITENHISEGCNAITYAQLKEYIDELDKEDAVKTMQNLFAYDFAQMRTSGKKIKVGFLVYSSAEWQCEKIYRLMDADPLFDPWIVLCGYGHGNDDFVRQTYIRTCSFFRKAGTYRIEYMGYCNRRIKGKRIDDYDILFYITPFEGLCPAEINLPNRMITQIAIHVPYGAYLMNKRDTRYGGNFFDWTVFELSWKFFAENAIIADIKARDSRLGDYNVSVSGLPKMDDLLDHSFFCRADLWKNEEDAKVKLIWAPHFNQQPGMNGTFRSNYRWFLEYAKNQREISWIVRPHPRMMAGMLESGIFQTEKEYQAYMSEWDSLPNARVIEMGPYFDIFDTSTAMIHDCGSFIVEYMYTDKPQLLLRPDKPRAMNEVGETIIDRIYSVRGDDFVAIERFIEHLKNGKDPKKKERRNLFEKFLDYKRLNGKPASDYIVDSIREKIVG